MTITHEETLDELAGELAESFPPEETTDSYFVIIPQWILEAASGEAIKLYGILSTYLNPHSRIVWPSRQTLAARLGKSRPESVDRYLAELSGLGALTVIKRYREDGGQTSNAYRLLRTPPRDISSPPLDKSAGAPPSKPRTNLKQLNLEERDLPPVGLSSPGELSTAPSTPVDNSPAELELDLGLHSADYGIFARDLPAEVAKIEADPFDEFWRVYPRRDDKKKARAAFTKALRDAPLEEILAGALRYREDPNREDKYTKYAATWLNAGAWGNGPLPSRGGGQRPNLSEKLAATAALSGSMTAAWAARFGGAGNVLPSGQLAIDSLRA